MRSSGHESFCCRYTWLPKAYAELCDDPAFFGGDDADAMVRLGLGKNMVRSLRFWVQAFGVAQTSKSGRELIATRLGNYILDTEKGRDPYLEDIQTLWLLHWNLATHESPLLAWDELLFRWPTGEFTRSRAVARLMERASELKMRASKGTLGAHFDVFISTYVATAQPKKSEVIEDSLDCPLAELRLIQAAGKQPRDKGPAEQIYVFRQEPKPDISSSLFMYCLNDFWDRYYSGEQTLSLQQIVSSPCSPGSVFRLPEFDVRERLENIESDSGGHFSYNESLNLQQLRREQRATPDYLAAVYGDLRG